MSSSFADPPSRNSSFSTPSSSNISAEARQPAVSSHSETNTHHSYSPTDSRDQSFSSTSGTVPGAGGSGLVFPGPGQGPRGVTSSRQTDDQFDDDAEDIESLSPAQVAGSSYQQYFPGPPPSSNSLPQREMDPAQYPLPTSRQQSIDSNAGGTSFDIPTFSMPFPPPPHASSSYSLSRGPPTPSSLSRSHLAAPGMHKTPSSSSLSASLSNNSAGGINGSPYAYESNGASPLMYQGTTAEPSPNPSQSSPAAPSGQVSYDPFAPVRAVSPLSSTARPPESDFERRGEGLGFGRAIVEQAGAQPQRPQAGMDARRTSMATTAGPGGYSDVGHGTSASAQDELVPTGFDEGVLRALCDMDVRWVFRVVSSLLDFSKLTTFQRCPSRAVRHASTSRADEAEHGLVSSESPRVRPRWYASR